MTHVGNPQSVPLEQVTEFLLKTLPFNTLAPSSLQDLAKQCLIDFFPKDTLIFEQDVTKVRHFYLIQQGGVRIYFKNEAGDTTLKDFRGEGEYFGAVPLIQETERANLNVETVEDTFCYLFPKEAFLHLVQTNPAVTNYYLRNMTQKLVNYAYAELRQRKATPRTESALRLVSVTVGDILKGPAQMIAASASAQQAAIAMHAARIGSLLVHDDNNQVIGIITDKDLRNKLVAKGLDYATPVRAIMSSPVQTIPAHHVCFDALLKMMTDHIHHLAVVDQDTIAGVITTHDIMVLQGTAPLALFKEIVSRQTIADLYELAPKVPGIIRNLVEEGAKADNIARMITLLNDQLVEKLLTILISELGSPPVPFCWMYMGSEGRKEQTFITDQDNAIIYRDPATESEAAAAAKYFATLGKTAIEHLAACGFPPCPGDIMASNPRWRQPARSWQSCFDSWTDSPDPQEIRNATIFFDFRGGFGNQELVETLRDHLSRSARQKNIFLFHLAKDCLESRPPISFFRNFIVEKDGEHKNQLDFKKRGLVPFVDFARVLALKHGIKATNTIDRLRLLAEAHHIPDELHKETTAAYEFLMHLRLIHQLQMLENGETPDNFINPGTLTDLEKQTLKEAFTVIGKMQSFLRQEFHLEQG